MPGCQHACLIAVIALAASVAHAAPEQGPAKPVVEDLAHPDQVKTMCMATRPVDRVYFPGDAVEKSKERDAYIQARNVAMRKLYRVSIPASGFLLGDYDEKQGTIGLDLSQAPRALHGVITLAMPSDDDIRFTVSPDQAKALMSAMKSGTATLVASFELSDESGAACSGTAAADVFAVNALPVAFDLRDGMGKLLGKAETARADRFRALLGGYSGHPTVLVGSADGEGVNAITLNGKLDTAKEPLQKCYVDRLKERPDAGGTVVLGVAVKPDGDVENVLFIADGLRDEPLRKCIDTTVRSLRFGGVADKAGAFLFRVPIELKLVASRQEE